MHHALKIIGQIVLFGVFLLAVIGKIVNPAPFLNFVKSVSGFDIWGARILFVLVVVTESMIGGALLLLRRHPGTYLVITFMFFAFSGVTGYAILQGFGSSCGCFGSLTGEDVPLEALIRNMLLGSIAMVLFFMHYKREK
ncbi:MauE/DoxX family redox-associated membrane protein [Rhodocaloribacter sp.]